MAWPDPVISDLAVRFSFGRQAIVAIGTGVLLAMVGATACSVGGSAGATSARAAPRWSAPAAVAGVARFNAVSCPVAGACVAVSDKQAAVYADGGWSVPVTIESGRAQINASPAFAKLGPTLAAISCPSASFCVAVDDAGRTLTFNGRRWSAPARVDPAGLVAVSCLSQRFCVAVDATGEALAWSGARWSAPRVLPGGPQLVALSCVSGPWCMAVDGAGSDAFVFQGGRWRDAGAGAAPGDLAVHGGSEPEVPSGVACSPSRACAVVDNFGVAWAWSRGAWSTGDQFDPQLLDASDHVSCPSSGFCVALDESGVASMWNGSAWSAGKLIAAPGQFEPSGLSCATARFCMAVLTDGRALRYS